MRVSVNWLRDYVEIDVSADELCEKLNMLGLAVESVEQLGAGIEGVKIGQILSIEPHPDADKLVVCKTDVGESEPLQIVCGAKNMKVGDRVPTATVGATLPGDFKIGRRKMRGVESQGMMCSPRELGLGEEHAGLMILDPESPVGADARDVLGLNDTIIEIEVTPNRNDWAGMIGVAREVAAAYGKPFTVPEVSLEPQGPDVNTLSSVDLQAPDLCPRYVGRVIQGVNVGPSPDWLKARLVAAGQRPINNVVDVTNYVLMETGHPLHAFDYDKLAENRIVVRRAHENERVKVIDQSEHTLDGEVLVIADAKAPVAVAGIMGGFDSEVEAGTVNLFIESAYFNPSNIRASSRRLNLVSESSQRFQRGADPEMASYAADRCCQLILETAGGTLAKGVMDCYPSRVEFPSITLRFERVNHLLGADVSSETQQSILRSIGFGVETPDEAQCVVQTPSWRPDVTCEADLIEEIGRCYGYDRIPARIPPVAARDERLAPEYYAVRKLRNYLVHIGLDEIVTWSFGSDLEVQQAGLNGRTLQSLHLANPLSENHTTLRTTLIPALLRTASNALRKGAREVKLFEIAPVFFATSGNGREPVQELRLAIALAGQDQPTHWETRERLVDFYDLKGYIEAVLDHFAKAGRFSDTDSGALQPGQRAAVGISDAELGILGRVSRSAASAYDLDAPVYIAEIALDALVGAKSAPVQYQPISAYPPSRRDLAVVVTADTEAGRLRQVATAAGGHLLKSVDIFDVFTGEQVREGRKSVALSLEFQSMDRTLTDQDTQKAFDKIVKRLNAEFGAEVR